MLVLCTSSPGSLIKAALLARTYNCPALHRQDFIGSLLAGSDVLDADAFKLSEAYRTYQQSHGPAPWVHNDEGKRMASLLYYAIRFHARDRYSLALQALDQALVRGAEYVMCRVSREARTLVTRSRQVCKELHRAYGFVRFSPADDHTIVGRAEFTHDIADLVLNYFAPRYSGCKITLIVKDQAYVWEKNKLTVSPADEAAACLPDDGFTAYWEAYYDSQVIAGRLNKKLARKHLPKKYWSWVEEGRKLK